MENESYFIGKFGEDFCIKSLNREWHAGATRIETIAQMHRRDLGKNFKEIVTYDPPADDGRFSRMADEDISKFEETLKAELESLSH